MHSELGIAMSDAELLEQQMILQAIAESNKLTSKSDEPEAKPKPKPANDEQKQPTQAQPKPAPAADANTNPEASESKGTNGAVESVDKDVQCVSDAMLAMRLQQQEQRELTRRKKLREMHDGKFGKVTSSSAHSAAAIPKAALNFYYDDDSLMNGALTKQQRKEANAQAEKAAVSKHDAKKWSKTHMQRLNEYETGGDLDTSMNIGNQAYNSFRNQLDKKGFISYHANHMKPKESKR